MKATPPRSDREADRALIDELGGRGFDAAVLFTVSSQNSLPAAMVCYQGLAMPCCMVATADRILLATMAERGASTAWNHPDYQAFREALASDSPPEIDRSCAIYPGTF
jgi:hypothetical protein